VKARLLQSGQAFTHRGEEFRCVKVLRSGPGKVCVRTNRVDLIVDRDLDLALSEPESAE
jgi:hypothetical protein